MEIIDYNNINFDKLKKLENILCTNDIYVDGNKIYKIFNQKDNELNNILEKLKLFESIYLDYFIVPKEIIFKDGNFIGIITRYIKKSDTFGNLSYKNGILSIIENLIDVSYKLKSLHYMSDRIVVGDMHFNNIIVDKDNKNYFIDTEGYGIRDYKPSDIPSITYNFYNWMNYYPKKDRNMDRISFILSFLELIFQKNVMSISEYSYDEKSEQIKILKDLKDVYLDLKYTYYDVPTVPYLHEIIKPNHIKKYKKEMH